MRTQTTQLKRQKNIIKTHDHHSVRTEGNLGTSMRALIILSGFYAVAESVLRESALTITHGIQTMDFLLFWSRLGLESFSGPFFFAQDARFCAGCSVFRADNLEP